ncbi:hypothetical protein [Secundilactobacillus silagei]|uniref:Uncharacterized protein n=1 Tax=Secundilactobacillus silagei JCM 19001 TaxID=1302250 RepID=A0A1Z5IFH8_9LACO|nr:hypothetical protein [Secundilactobacillus silagei]TDG71603.1 hypothetical protein C5L25_002260 [Secundilactobacillus silagei JCM 19001]GAX00408.1 hypothetical protein IWT126_00423 [Secundilactobacillus silagei JCM 19001]
MKVRSYHLILSATLALGTAFTIIPLTTVTSQAATHIIKWHGHQYKSNYSLTQMRHKHHLKFKKSKIDGFTYEKNYFYGVTTHGAYVHRANDTHAFPSIHHKGTYAMFRTKIFDGGNAYGLEYVNLKTGKHYHDQA